MNKDKVRCESCHQEFNWWDLLWDLEEGREVCVNCYHAPKSNRLDGGR